jgi:hypothetical protein
MKYTAFKYSLKIWFTTIILGPSLIFAIKAYNKDCNYCDLKEYYWATIGTIMAFSLLLPLMLLAVIVVRKRFKRVEYIKLPIVLTLLVLTIAYILTGEKVIGHFNKDFIFDKYTMLFNIIFPCVVGGCAWFYNLNSTTDRSSLSDTIS